MKKTNLIQSILEDAKIHHNISTLGLKLPDAPEGCPDDIFWDACGMLVSDFCDNWLYEPINDSGNRNLCGCARKVICKLEDFKKDNGYDGRAYIDQYHRWMDLKEASKLGIVGKQIPGITSDGACKKHDLYHCYTHGRMGATLYWDKYWKSFNSGLSFKYYEHDLQGMPVDELKIISKEMGQFSDEVSQMLKGLFGTLKYEYEQWEETDKEEKREEALGYNKSLKTLLNDDNPQIVRLAKGIKKELIK